MAINDSFMSDNKSISPNGQISKEGERKPAIYAYGKPEDSLIPFVVQSLTDKEHPVSRFMWSYFSGCDLNVLKNKKWKDMSDDEKNCWKQAHQLLNFEPGDWILHINVPSYGMVTAGKIVSNYIYQDNLPEGWNDGRHCFEVSNVITFDRNDKRVHPKLSSRLKLQGRYWRIYCEKEFEETLKLLQNTSHADIPDKYHLAIEANQILAQLTQAIQGNNPGKIFERFLAEVFRKVPGVIDVKENGSGYKTDYGADLIIKYKTGFLPELEKERTLVVQAKSYEGEHWETNAVEQLRTAIEKFEASMGIIMTTGMRTENLENEFKKLFNEMEKKNIDVYLLAGTEVAQFVLQYGMNTLLGGND